MFLAVSESVSEVNGRVLTTPSVREGAAASQWFNKLQEASWEAFQSVPMPKRTDETWRFANLKKLAFDRFVTAEPVDEATSQRLVSQSNRLREVAAKLIFVNERLVESDHVNTKLEGVICLPLMQAVEEHGQLLQEHFMTQEATLGSQRFALLHKSRTKSGLFVYVPSGVNLDLPVEVYHWIAGAGASVFPHTLVVTGENASVTVVDHFQSADREDPGLCCGVVDLVAGPGSKIKYVACQTLNRASSNIQISSALASADADLKSLQVQLGSSWSRAESVSHLLGKGANSDMLSVSIPAADQEIDQRTLQHHAEAHTTSDLLYKNALYDRARSIFAGLIMVDSGAHHTDAFQTCRNLLLSDEAEANAMPGLEINADQVKCSHGATSGPITDEEVFYFNARGIPTETAKKLITFGFTREVIARLDDPAIEAMVSALLETKSGELEADSARG